MPGQRSASPAEAMTAFTDFMMIKLPRLNCACRDGEISLNAWIDELTPIVKLVTAVAGEVTPTSKEYLLRGGGMIVLSAERHAQPKGFQPGEILLLLPGLANMLSYLAGAHRRPALTHVGYWLTNLPPLQLTFTDSSHEKFFISAVQSQTTMRRSAHHLLMPICAGAIHPATSVAARMVNAAAAILEQSQLQYRDFHHGPDGNPGQTAAEFNEMRAWLLKTSIGGKIYGGPNAAYIPEMAATDFILGTTDAHYEEYIHGFFPELDADERNLLMTYAEQPSIIDALSTAMGYSDAKLMSIASMNEVAARLGASPNLLTTAMAAKALYKAFCGGSGAHVGLINTHLVKYSESITPKQRAALPVDPGEGVGGHGHAHTRRLHDTRRTNPSWKNLTGALGKIGAVIDRNQEVIAA